MSSCSRLKKGDKGPKRDDGLRVCFRTLCATQSDAAKHIVYV